MEFAKRLKELRTEKNLTQKQIADVLKVDGAAVRNWELGKNQTDFETLIEIADYFKVTTDYLLGREKY